MQAYEGVESADNFSTAAALEDYRALVLEKSQEQVEFIRRRTGGRRLRVLEFCSGNGRLLIALARAGLLEYGLGVEVAQSRTAFAETWARDSHLDNIRLVAADALDFTDFERATFDLTICITGAFNYFYPMQSDAPGLLLTHMREALKPDGAALLELYRLPAARERLLSDAGGHLRTWDPLPERDRFAYYLSEFSFRGPDNVLKHDKTFIGRDGRIDSGRTEILKFYSIDELTAVLGENQLRIVQVYGDFAEHPYDPGESAAQVLWSHAS